MDARTTSADEAENQLKFSLFCRDTTIKPPHPRNASQYLQLFECIRLNKIIHQKIDEVATDPKKSRNANDLKKVIEEGDANAEIFKDPDCDIYILHLIKEGLIDFDVGMTVYTYLMFLMQFTEKQAMREEYKDFKDVRPLKVAKISENGVLTQEGKLFLTLVGANLRKMGKTVDIAELERMACALPPSEQWIIQMPIISAAMERDHAHKNPGTSEYLFGLDRILLNPMTEVGLVFIPHIGREESGYLFTFPSVTFLRQFLPLMGEDPMLAAFVLGATGHPKVHALQKKNLHPVLLHSRFVKKNVMDAHDIFCGPVGALLHDWIHISWANRFSAQERQMIYDVLIASLVSIKDPDEPARSRIIDDLCNELGDFNLLPVSLAGDTMLGNYLHSCFTSMPYIFPYYGDDDSKTRYSLGDANFDAMFYQMSLISLRENNWSQLQREGWECCRNQVRFRVDMCRGSNGYAKTQYSSAIAALAELTVKPRDLVAAESKFDHLVSWVRWLEIFKETDLNELWQCVNAPENVREFLVLIEHFHIVFFPPYLPLTEEKRMQYVEFFAAKRALFVDADNAPLKNFSH